MSHLVYAEDLAAGTWPAELIRSAAAALDPTARIRIVSPHPDRPYDLLVDITPASSTGYQVLRHRDGAALTTDGDMTQVAAVAAWARALLPETTPSPSLVIHESNSVRVVLTAGITPAEVESGWEPVP